MSTKPLTTSSGDNIATPMPAYNAHQLLCELPAALNKGTEGMRLAGTKYLPQEDAESDTKYTVRLNRSTLTNIYVRTIQKMKGEVFGTLVAESDEISDDIKELLDDIDNEGNDVTRVASDIFDIALNTGVCHVLVDYPPVVGKTKAEHKAAGARPYWVIIKPSQVIGWRTESEGGQLRLTQLRIKESVEVPDGKYGIKTVERIKLLEPGSYEVYENSDDGWKIAKDERGEEIKGTTSLNIIPFVTLRLGDELTHMTAMPPLLDLAHLNRAHWESSSDQRNILHYARLVTYFGKLLDVDAEGSVIFGANRLVHSTSPDADLKVVEHSGAAIESGRQDLQDLETSMSLFGLTFMMPKGGNETATAKAIDTAENDSALKGWVRSLNNSLDLLLDYTHQWLGSTPVGELRANDDFQTPLRGTDGTVLLQGFHLGLLPRDLVVEEFKRRGIITQDIDLEDLADMIQKDQKKDSVLGGVFGDTSKLLGQSEGAQA